MCRRDTGHAHYSGAGNWPPDMQPLLLHTHEGIRFAKTASLLLYKEVIPRWSPPRITTHNQLKTALAHIHLDLASVECHLQRWQDKFTILRHSHVCRSSSQG